MIGHWQTISAALFPPPAVHFERERWATPDGDFIDLDFAGDARAPLMVLLHGLEGSSDSHYARLLARAMPAAGWRVAIPHWRGCSGEPNRKPRAYHSGDTKELDWILRRFHENAGHQVDVIGVSLGGNVLLKWLGERAGEATAIVRRAAAISAPLDLAAAGAALDRGLSRLIYTRMFLSTLKPKSLAQLDRFPGIFDRATLSRSTTFREFDNLYTAPRHGFRDVDHYWTSSSSGPWLERIAVPTLVLNARNDPFLPERALVDASRKTAPNVLLEFPRTGGHVGFRGPWLAQRLIKFFQA
ncbi:MAG TPA: alpha/beta fold hydrolase [Burkholderiales bacterium]|nr:alpha/beta fold hydrolase [Burkholderiales bacterium]